MLEIICLTNRQISKNDNKFELLIFLKTCVVMNYKNHPEIHQHPAFRIMLDQTCLPNELLLSEIITWLPVNPAAIENAIKIDSIEQFEYAVITSYCFKEYCEDNDLKININELPKYINLNYLTTGTYENEDNCFIRMCLKYDSPDCLNYLFPKINNPFINHTMFMSVEFESVKCLSKCKVLQHNCNEYLIGHCIINSKCNLLEYILKNDMCEYNLISILNDGDVSDDFISSITRCPKIMDILVKYYKYSSPPTDE